MSGKALLVAVALVLSVDSSAAVAAPPERLQHLPSTSIAGDFAVYKNAGYGVSFVHPADWKEGKPEDSSGVVKFSGVTKDGLNGEVSFSQYIDSKSTPSQVKVMLENFLFPKLPEYKKLQESRVGIGASRKLPADLADITFSMNGLKIQQRYVLFQSQDVTYALVFTSPAGHFNALAPTFNHVLLSVQTGRAVTAGGATTSASAPGATEKSVSLKRYQSNLLPLSFSYPDGWVVENTNRRDEPVNIKGKNAEGRDAFIVLHRGEMSPTLSIDDVADALEKEYFVPLKDFHRVNRQNQNFGTNSKVNGVVQEQTFVQDGAAMKQMCAMFFHGDKTYALSMVAPGWKDSEIHQVFSKVLASVEVRD